MAQHLFYTFVIFATIGMALAQFSGIEYVSPVFRVSPYGQCGVSTLRTDAPCFANSGNPIYDFYNITTTAQQIKSIVVIPFQTATYYYLGMNTNEIWVVARDSSNQFTYIQNVTAPASNWAFGFTDTTNSYVAFVSQGTGSTVAKYQITVNGTLVTPPSTVNAGVNNVQSVVYREPFAWVAGGAGAIAKIDLNGVNVSSTVNVATTIPTVGTIQCAAVGSTSTPDILYASSAGVVFFYHTSTDTVDATSATVTGESFSTACGAKGNSYGIFFGASSGKLYQFNFPSGASTLSSPNFIIENVGVGKSSTSAITNTDQTGLYLFTYTNTGSIPDTIYEFYLSPSSVDFSSVIQPTSPDQDPYYRNVFATYLIGTTIYISTSIANFPRIYQFTIPSTLARATNSSKPSTLLYADYSLPENPTGPNGKTNSIADVGQTAGNGDLLLGNGVASVTVPANSSISIPSRGPVITYLRGTKSVPPARGGAANTDAALALRLVSLDEVSTPGVVVNGSALYNLKRSMPFYSADIAPWYQKLAIKPDGTTVTGTQWEIGVTSNLADSAHQYAYLVPPYPQVVNNSVSRPKSSRIANQFTSGYVSFLLQQEVFLPNTTMIQLNNVMYNVTTRTFRYAFTINSWQFLSASNYLRLNLILGIGPDGNGTVAVFNADGNGTTTNSQLTSYVIVADSAEWTLVLPQSLISNGAVVNVSAPTVYDPSTNVISVFIPYSVDPQNAGKSGNQTYTLLLEYSYIAPPLPSASIQDGGGPHLLPLWIVLGVLGFIVIVGIIIAIIVIIVVYRLVWKNQTEYEIRSTFDKTENALDRDKGF